MPKSSTDYKSGLKLLKRVGLYSGDLRKKVTGYGKSVFRKFGDILSGEAKAVKVPDKKTAKEFKEQGHVVKNKIVVVKSTSSEKVSFDKKTRTIEKTIEVNGRKMKVRTITNAEKGGEYRVITPTQNRKIGNKDAMMAFVNEYKVQKQRWPDVEDFIFWDEGEDGEYEPKRKVNQRKKRKASKRKKR